MYSAKEEYDHRLQCEHELRSQEERRVCGIFSFFSSRLFSHSLLQSSIQLKDLERKERELMERLTRQTSIDIEDGV